MIAAKLGHPIQQWAMHTRLYVEALLVDPFLADQAREEVTGKSAAITKKTIESR